MEAVVAMETQTEFVASQVNEVGVEIHATSGLEPVANGTGDQGKDEQASGPSELRGESLKGKELRKKFGRKFYKGTVTNYDPDTKWYKVLYEDGDSEDLEWSELEPLLITEQPKKRQAGPISPRGNKKRKTKALEQLGEAANQAGDEVVAEPEQENVVLETTKYVLIEELQGAGDDAGAATQEVPVHGVDTTAGVAGQDSGASPVHGEDTTAGVAGQDSGAAAQNTGEVATQDAHEGAATTETPEAKDEQAKTPKRRGRPPKAKANSTPKEQTSPTRKSMRLSAPAKPSTENQESAAKSKGKAAAVQEKPAWTRSASKGKRVEKAQQEATEEKQTGFSPHDRGMKLKGRKLEKVFDGMPYKGEVVNYDRQNKYYKIHYEDGDEEELTWGELEPLLLPLEDQTSGDEAAGTSTPRSTVRRRVQITTTIRKTKLVQAVTKASPSLRPRRKASVVS